MSGSKYSKSKENLLVQAALDGQKNAIEQIETKYIQDVVPNLRRLSLDSDQCDEVLQRLMVKLFAPATGSPRLSHYLGKGHLFGFIRTTAIRLAIDLLRHKRPSEEEILDQLSDPRSDAEMAVIKKQYKMKLSEALKHAWNNLDAKQRLVLKLQLQDNLTIDEMARLFSCHRSTAARKVVSARSELLRLTKQFLRTHHNLGKASIDEGLKVVKSQFESILSKAFKDADR